MQTFAAFLSDPIAILVVGLISLTLATWLVKGRPVSVRAAVLLLILVVAVVGLLST